MIPNWKYMFFMCTLAFAQSRDVLFYLAPTYVPPERTVSDSSQPVSSPGRLSVILCDC